MKLKHVLIKVPIKTVDKFIELKKGNEDYNKCFIRIVNKLHKEL